MISTARRAPLVLVPKLTAAIWGGDALVRRYHKRGDPSVRWGESWECWDDNAIVSGAFAGATLARVRAELGAELMGPLDPTVRFPILTKVIDAHDALSVQVHPDDAYARAVEAQPVGKTECWYVLATQRGAELVLGWTRETDRAEYERRVADGTLGELLRRVPVQAGEAFYLPAGTLHAIGAGIQLFEVQQASDLTYRIFDWNRVGADGKPRALHVAKAADVLDFRATNPGAVRQLSFRDGGATRTLAIADHRFAVERLAFADEAVVATGGRPLAITAMDAGLRLRGDAAETRLAAWETAVVPAAAERVGLIPAAAGEAAALLARVSPDLAQMRVDAVRAGVDGALLDAFFVQFAAAAAGAG